jgi:hypothetical protein
MFTQATSPAVYGGMICVINNSSSNVFINFFVGDVMVNMLCVEKQEELYIQHYFGKGDQSNPNNYYTRIVLYEMETGVLLKDIAVNNTFILDSGCINNGSALFKLLIDDNIDANLLQEE